MPGGTSPAISRDTVSESVLIDPTGISPAALAFANAFSVMALRGGCPPKP